MHYEKISKFKCTLNKDRKIFKVSITSASVNHIQVQIQSKFKCDDLGIKCQSFTVEIKSKCDDLVDQVSIYQ